MDRILKNWVLYTVLDSYLVVDFTFVEFIELMNGFIFQSFFPVIVTKQDPYKRIHNPFSYNNALLISEINYFYVKSNILKSFIKQKILK